MLWKAGNPSEMLDVMMIFRDHLSKAKPFVFLFSTVWKNVKLFVLGWQLWSMGDLGVLAVFSI